MAVSVTHTKVLVAPDSGAEDKVYGTDWNAALTVTGLGTAAEANTGDFDAAGAATTAITNHEAAADPHVGYQKESEKNAASGYAGLSASSKLTGSQQVYGTGADTACVGNDARLSDARTPTAHAASHYSAGPDPLNIKNLGGFPGGTTDFLRADGAFASPGASSTNIKQTEIDFGTTPVAEASFTVTDADVSATNQLIGSVAYEAPTGKDLDELDMDGLDLKFAPGIGEFTIYARGMDGYVADKFKINYLIG
jgi:hypothetical protein